MEPVINKRIFIELDDGRRVGFLPYFTINMLIEFQALDKTDKTPEEQFRELISRSGVIEGFAELDYLGLTDADLTRIAMSFDSVENECLCPGEDVFIMLLKEIDKEAKRIEADITGIFSSTNILQTIEIIAEASKSAQEMTMKLAEKLTPIVTQIQAVGAQWAEAVDKFIKEQEAYLDSKQKASLIASKYDWFISHDLYTSKVFYEKLVAINTEGGSAQLVDELFLEYYDEEIRNKMLDDLRDMDFLKQHDPILNQVQIGYNMRLYYLVVPTVFALIEGMIARGFNHKGRMKGSHIKMYFDELFKEKSVCSLNEVINKRMLAGFEHGSEVDSPISRHAILHGGDITYGRAAVALRLFLILYDVGLALVFRETKSDQ